MAGTSHRLGAIFLVAAGVVLCLAGAGATAIGLLDPRLISDQLPPEAGIDALAVGGAAVALGVGTVLLGIVHLLTAVGLRRGSGAAETAGVVLTAIMAMLSIGSAISAAVSIASGAAPAVMMVPASIGLGGAAVAYAATATGIIGARKRVS